MSMGKESSFDSQKEVGNQNHQSSNSAEGEEVAGATAESANQDSSPA